MYSLLSLITQSVQQIFGKSQALFLPFYYSKPFVFYSPVQWRVTCPFFQTNLFDCLHSINPRSFDLNCFFFHFFIFHISLTHWIQSTRKNGKSQALIASFFAFFYLPMRLSLNARGPAEAVAKVNYFINGRSGSKTYAASTISKAITQT